MATQGRLLGRERVVGDEAFEAAWKLYPQRDTPSPKRAALRAWLVRVRLGYSEDSLGQGVSRYARYASARKIVGTPFVMQPARFFGPDLWFLEPWGTRNGNGAAPGSPPKPCDTCKNEKDEEALVIHLCLSPSRSRHIALNFADPKRRDEVAELVRAELQRRGQWAEQRPSERKR